jgi:hypothetical protein
LLSRISFAYCAFARDSDNIDRKDVLDSASGSGGAYDLIGNQYYRDAFYNQIGQESRAVLRIMAEELSKGEKEALSKQERAERVRERALRYRNTANVSYRPRT